MTNRSYLLRLIVPFAVMIVCVVALSGYLIYYSGQQAVLAQQAEDLQRITGLVGPQVLPLVDQRREYLNKLAGELDIRLTVISGDGTVQLDTSFDAAKMDNHNNRPEIIGARTNGTGESFRTSVSAGEAYVYAARKIQGSDYVIRASYPQRAPFVLNAHTWLLIMIGVLLAILVVTWMAIKLHKRWIAPVRKLALAAERMAAGEWKTRVETSETDELREFSTRLNILAEQAHKQFKDFRHQRSDLNALVDSLPDPLLLTDPQQRIVIINAPAARLLGVTTAEAIGQNAMTILNESSVLAVFDLVLGSSIKSGQTLLREIRLTRSGQKFTYQAVAGRTGGGGVVMVLRDVTKLAAAVQMKTDFVANASHELRTPIAAIKLAFETLSEVYTEDPQQSERCITIIEGHLKRLEDMLQDLLDLSRVESTDIKPEFSEVRGVDMLANIRSTMGALARNKDIDLHVGGDDNVRFISDRRLIDLALKNLVENSIKYTPAGGQVKVDLSCREVDGRSNIIVKVSDTGIGIPQQHLERVFERFYQVDSARSGSAGRGTGLGLAIVKHAIHALGGQVSLESVVGKGTIVTCTVPDGRSI